MGIPSQSAVRLRLLQLMVAGPARQHLLRHAPFGLASCSSLLDEYFLPRQDRERGPGSQTRPPRAFPASTYFSGVIGDCAVPWWNGAQSPQGRAGSRHGRAKPQMQVEGQPAFSTILIALMGGVSYTRTIHHSSNAAHRRHCAWLKVHMAWQGERITAARFSPCYPQATRCVINMVVHSRCGLLATALQAAGEPYIRGSLKLIGSTMFAPEPRLCRTSN